MATNVNAPAGLMSSILDRLVDPDSEGTAWRMGYDLQQIIDSIRRGLEDLLNTHQGQLESLANWPELSNSLMTYGLPDFASLAMEKGNIKEITARRIEDVINRFEPRLRNVRAKVVEGTSAHDRQARFHLEAQLNVDPAPEVSFETIVELTTGRTAIQTSATTA